MSKLPTKGKLNHRTLIIRQSNQITTLTIRDKTKRRIVTYRETETLHIERLSRTIPIQSRVSLGSIQLLYTQHITLITVAKIERSSIECTILENSKNLVLCTKLAKMLPAPILIKTLNISIVPNILAANGRYTLVLQGNPLDAILGYQITAAATSLDSKSREIVLDRTLLQHRLRTEGNTNTLRLTVVVGRHPHNLAPRLTLSNIIFLVTSYRCDIEALSIVNRRLAITINHIVYGTIVTTIEDIGINQLLGNESLVRHLGNPILAILADSDDFTKIGTIANILSAIILFESDAHETLGQVGVQLRIIVNHLGGRNRLKISYFRLAREQVAILFLKRLKPVNSVFCQVLQFVSKICNLPFYTTYFLLYSLNIKLGNLAYRLFYQLKDIFHRNFTMNHRLVLLHGIEYLLKLYFPGLLILFQNLVDAVFKEDFLQRIVMPIVFKLIQSNL